MYVPRMKTIHNMTADDITRALWDAPAAHCPPDGARLAFPDTDRAAFPGETAGVAWCHDCRADGLGFIRAAMLAGSEPVEVIDSGENIITFRASDLVIRVLGAGVSGREAAQLRARTT